MWVWGLCVSAMCFYVYVFLWPLLPLPSPIMLSYTVPEFCGFQALLFQCHPPCPVSWFWTFFFLLSRSKSGVLTHWCHFCFCVWRRGHAFDFTGHFYKPMRWSDIKEECVLWPRKLTDWLSTEYSSSEWCPTKIDVQIKQRWCTK